MENKLKAKFQFIAMSCVVLVMIMVVAPINTVVMHKMESNIDIKLKVIAENDGVFPAIGVQYQDGFIDLGLIESYIYGKDYKNEDRYESSYVQRNGYYSVKTDKEGKAYHVDVSHIQNVEQEEAFENARYVITLGNEKGYRRNFKYLIRETEYGKLVVFLDCFAEQHIKVMLLLVSFGVAFLVCSAVMVLMRFFSMIAIKPFAENISNQRRFITDAGHELKTPLAIISANAEVLELTVGENEWIDSIKNQTVRMNELIKQLVFLCKYSEKGSAEEFVDFSISDALKESIEAFTAVAETKNKRLVSDITQGVTYKGDEASIRQLFTILLDNALKYASENGEVRVALSKHGKSVRIIFENDCDSIDEESLSHVFERFYRADSSRARETGGFGIGLSIADAIVDAHKGRITARSQNGKTVVFTVTL